MKNRLPPLLALSLIYGWASPVWSEEGDQQEPGTAARDIASQVPDTDIFLLALGADGEPEKASLYNLTHRPGYDNQPAFLPGGQGLLFSAIGEDMQSDVYRLDLASGNLLQLTHTAESEYSPTPLVDGGFSVVRVETDGAQQLWRYANDGRPVKRLLNQFDNVGYHRWLAQDSLALFLVAEPMELVLATLDGGPVVPVATGIGRSFVWQPESGRLYFLSELQGDRWQLRSREDGSGEIFTYLDAPGQSQDMALDGRGRVWMASGTTLWRWQPGQQDWLVAIDFGNALPGAITRLVFSEDDSRLAMVVSIPDGAGT
jgi:hypothetical protein